jgi:hypothetical protein
MNAMHAMEDDMNPFDLTHSGSAIPASSLDFHRWRAHRLRAAMIRLALRRLRRYAWTVVGAAAGATRGPAAVSSSGGHPCHSST